jgi:hypothetical protein
MRSWFPVGSGTQFTIFPNSTFHCISLKSLFIQWFGQRWGALLATLARAGERTDTRSHKRPVLFSDAEPGRWGELAESSIFSILEVRRCAGWSLPQRRDVGNTYDYRRKEEITSMRRIAFVEYKPAEVKLPIYLDNGTNRMSCSYAGKTYEHTDLQQLKDLVLAAIKESVILSWTPIIIITVGSGRDYQKAQITLERARKYYAYHDTLGHKTAHWETKPDTRLAHSDTFNWPTNAAMTLPSERDRHTLGKTYYLAYDEETWKALEEIESYLLIAQKKLLSTLTSEAGVKTALQTCQLLFDAFTTRADGTSEDYGSE